MYEYTQIVLEKVSFDATLFRKELQKAAKRLLPHELEELKIWLRQYCLANPNLEGCMVQLT